MKTAISEGHGFSRAAKKIALERASASEVRFFVSPPKPYPRGESRLAAAYTARLKPCPSRFPVLTQTPQAVREPTNYAGRRACYEPNAMPLVKRNCSTVSALTLTGAGCEVTAPVAPPAPAPTAAPVPAW